ncbi:MAG TPA: FAD-binding oxidoreductase [Chitinophagaceae bacterium]|nr:FAD-binding oxidoreductase [Chitinophagaceae bacterium]
MRVEFLVVGQGLCGTFLSWFLHRAGKSFLVMDQNDPASSSRVAAGIINPVTGRRLAITWMAEELLPFARKTYQELGQFLDAQLIFQKNLIEFFPNPHQRELFLERVQEQNAYLHSFPEQNAFNSVFRYELGCGEIRHSFVVDVETMQARWRKFLSQQNRLLDVRFDPERLHVRAGGIEYDDIAADRILFCDGSAGIRNPFFSSLPFSPNKGEALILEIPELPPHHIYKKGFLLVPLPDENKFWFGSNYQWKFTDPAPSTEFFEQARRHLLAWLKLPYRILDHKAGIRPATLERRPFVGVHPHHEAVVILNGMGTKGCSLAPFFASGLTRHLLDNEAIMPEADVRRFSKALSR